MENSSKIIISTHNNCEVLEIEKIAYCKADGSYSIIYTADGKSRTISKPLIYVERMLLSNNFIRCHNTYIVNIYFVKLIISKKRTLIIFDQNIPISRRRYKNTISKLRNLIAYQV